MPIPTGAHYVPGEPNRVQLAGGDIVTRAYARTLGARELGYKNEHAYRGNAGRDENYFRALMRGPSGRQIQAQAIDNGLTMRELKRDVIAARNQKPSSRRSGGPAYQQFMEDYDLWDQGDDWADVDSG